MKVYLEFLYHFIRDRCKKYWAIADIELSIGSRFTCPHCGAINEIDSIEAQTNPAEYQVTQFKIAECKDNQFD